MRVGETVGVEPYWTYVVANQSIVPPLGSSMARVSVTVPSGAVTVEILKPVSELLRTYTAERFR